MPVSVAERDTPGDADKAAGVGTPLEPVSRPRRRWLRFSLRALLVAVLVIGGTLGWLV
jgi:hypothetical protein